MLGADVFVIEVFGLSFGERHDFAGTVGETVV